MFAKPQDEHRWLDQLVGKWSLQHTCKTPDGGIASTQGRMTCRSLLGMWLICESEGESGDGESWASVMTVGFDPAVGRYVGTYIGSMLASIWHYEGIMDPSGKRLPLETKGPSLVGTGTCKYRDTIEVVSDKRWLFSSEYQNESGEWTSFMQGEHTRI
jgi:hypothetical protein